MTFRLFLYILFTAIRLRFVASACSGGTSIGSFVFLQPNRSTTGVVGTKMRLSWSMTPLVKIIPSSIDIFMANVDPNGQGYSFKIPVVKNLAGTLNSTDWVVSNNNDGVYMMRIGISSRDPLLNTTAWYVFINMSIHLI